MANLIRIKGGSGDVPQLQEREIAFRKDEKSIYIGTENGNVRLCSADDIKKILEIGEKITELEARLEALENN